MLEAAPTLATVTECPDPAEFAEKYGDPERPLLIKGLAKDWPAREKWSAGWLRKTLRKNKKVRDRGVFFLSKEPVLKWHIKMPAFLEEILNSGRVMPESVAWRFWINTKANKTNFHYDTNCENVITVQIRGRKEWILVSPDTPMPCYPFTNFTVLKDEEKLLAGREYYKFDLEEGDLLYVPPHWYHRAIGKEDENININWTFTKWETSVVTREGRRDLERCNVLDTFKHSKSSLTRNIYNRIIRALPNVGGISWGLKSYVASPYKPTRWALIRRFFAELGRIPAAIATIPAIRAEVSKVDKT